MRSYKEFSEDVPLYEGAEASNKVRAMASLVETLRDEFGKYTIATRHFVWERLNSPKGKELLAKILRNPKTKFTDSEFVKLVEHQ